MDQQDLRQDAAYQNSEREYPVSDGGYEYYSEYAPYRERTAQAPAQASGEAERKGGFFKRVLRFTSGAIIAATAAFACGIIWIWGLDYLGIIDFSPANSGKNEFNQGSSYDEYEDFYDYFDDFFGGGVITPNQPGSGTTEPQASTPGIGVTILEVPQLDFIIENKYTGGLVIDEISPTGALAGTGVQVGELIVAANGQACPTIAALDIQLKATGVGGEMVLTVARYDNGVAVTRDVTITLIDLSAAN